MEWISLEEYKPQRVFILGHENSNLALQQRWRRKLSVIVFTSWQCQIYLSQRSSHFPQKPFLPNTASFVLRWPEARREKIFPWFCHFQVWVHINLALMLYQDYFFFLHIICNNIKKYLYERHKHNASVNLPLLIFILFFILWSLL